jgi:hypothetical protein
LESLKVPVTESMLSIWTSGVVTIYCFQNEIPGGLVMWTDCLGDHTSSDNAVQVENVLNVNNISLTLGRNAQGGLEKTKK